MITTHDNVRGFIRATLDIWLPSARVTESPGYGADGAVQVQVENGSNVRDVAVSYLLPVTEDRIRRDLATLLEGVVPIHLRDA